jgi:sugar phosphate isomerase/epimerase
MLDRRLFLRTSASAAAASAIAAWAAKTPVKIAHREGNMPRKPGVSAYELASGVPGLSGLEIGGARVLDRANALEYKKESNRWRVRTVSLYTSFPQGTTLVNAGAPAEEALRKTIQAGELLGASVIAVGGFFNTCPKMDSEESYGPCVELLKKTGPVAADSGMTIALELSLSLEEYQKLMTLVGHPAVRPYWDATGTDHMGHPGDGVKGLEVFGNQIPMMHLKNGRAGFLMSDVHLLDKHPRSPVPEQVMSIKWAEVAFPILKKAEYEGWFVFETPHRDLEAFVTETTKNVEFVMKSMS